MSPTGRIDHDKREAVLSGTAASDFALRFGRPPRWIVAAPGRVNLIGDHTDYSGGLVLPMAIERYTVIAAAPAVAGAGRRLQLYSAAVNQSVDIPLDSPPSVGEPSWANYARGVVAGFLARGQVLPALDALVVSDVPLGGGLSSSAALEVALATLLETALGQPMDVAEKARLCREAEHEYARVPCGIMDQLISAMGNETGALLIDCRTGQTQAVPFADPTVSLLIANSEVRHSLGAGAYALRRSDCIEAARALGVPELGQANPAMVQAAEAKLPGVLYRRARHVVTENERARAAAQAFAAGDWRTAGALMYESHRSLRDDFEVSSPELDTLVELARDIGESDGVFGARMTGGGFGGCMVTLVATDRASAVGTRLADGYRQRHERALTWFIARPSRGAHVIQG